SPAHAPAPVVTKPGEAPSPAEEAEAKAAAAYGRQSPVRYRGTFDDKQEAAARPGDYTLDPEYRGFIPIPDTVFMIKFNPKPRVDNTVDSDNPGNDSRFVTATIPVEGTPQQGGGERFNANGNGSQIRLDMRAPSMAGNFRFYYQNDFFGSNSKDFQYRLQHLYGQFLGFTGGFTYGIFEDPDAWPDTVDYEGPNAVIFARRPLVHYRMSLADEWNLTLGLEDPDILVDTSGSGDPPASRRTRAPDGGFNVRWEPGSLGHMQFSTIMRSIGVNGGLVDDQDVFGWGVNLAGTFHVTDSDTLQFWGVYGHGVGGMGNDTSFVNSDAALDSDGDLVALEYVSGLLAFTHRWTPRWRSTATYGYANLENTGTQPDDAYDFTHYASANLIYQIFKRFSVGVEALYGFKEVKNGDDGDVFRFQVSLLYSVFD
ncbi:MAG: DcaP family trimeric outer membrane transporter, partial [Rubrobacteraceae bacterium]